MTDGVTSPLSRVSSDEVSVAEAHRRTGISVKALIAALKDGRLEGQNARRPGEHWGRAWRISPAAIERFIASCPPCPWPGCDRPGVTAAGRCSKQHAATLERLNSPEAQAKARAASAARRGVPKPHSPEHDRLAHEGLLRFYDDPERSHAKRRADSERLRRSWETGE